MYDITDMVQRATRLSTTNGREDLRDRLHATRARLRDPMTRVFVVGEFKKGKSQLINALVNAPACPVHDDIATVVPTTVKFGRVASAAILKPNPKAAELDAVRLEIGLDEIEDYVAETRNPANEKNILAAEVMLPQKILADGLALVDSPGVGGLQSPHAVNILAALPSAHAVIFVTDASQEFTEPELAFLKNAMRICPNVVCVMSKTDFYPEWRTIAALNEAHLAALNERIPFFAVSSNVRILAARQNDSSLNEESGFVPFVQHLRRDIVGSSEVLQRRAALHDVVSTTDHLSLALQAELGALASPEQSSALVAELEISKERVNELRRRSSRWQTTLHDGMSDLIADMEHDLRERMRTIQRDAEDAIDGGDPGPLWSQFVEWVDQRVADAVSETFVWTQERAQWLSLKVAADFAEDEVGLPQIEVSNTSNVLDPVNDISMIESGHVGAMQKVYIGLKGSYGGVLMVGILTGIIGMSIINPLSLAAGAVIGRKAYREDKEARLARRRMEAKSLVRRYVDDVIFHVGKQLKDRLRLVQRTTRDHFTERADELHRSLTESVRAAQSTATLFAADREKRAAALRGSLRAIDDLRTEARQHQRKLTTPGRKAHV